MVTGTAVAGIAVIALGLVLTPGPDMVHLVSRSVTQGRRAGLLSLLGVAAGFGVHLAAAAGGLATVFVAVPAAYTALEVVGAGYLLYLAWQALRPGGTGAFAPRELPVDPARRLVTMGLVTNLLNPEIAGLHVSLLPRFIDPGRGSVVAQSLVPGAVRIGIALTVNALIELCAGSTASFLCGRPRWLRVQRGLMGAVLGALAVRLLADRSPVAVR